MDAAPLNTPLMSVQDPFYAARDALDAEVQGLRVRFDDWLGQLQTVNTASDVKFRQKHEEIKRDLTALEQRCSKLRSVVDATERNRAKFSHIDDRELAARKSGVDRLVGLVAQMRTTYGSRETQGKLDADQRRELTARMAREQEDASKAANAYTRANADYMKDKQQERVLMRKEQDVVLDSLATGMDTMKEMAVAIKTELEDQAVMLEDVEKEVDSAQTKMDSAMAGIQKLLKTKDNCQLMIIFGLVVVFIIVTAIALT